MKLIRDFLGRPAPEALQPLLRVLDDETGRWKCTHLWKPTTDCTIWGGLLEAFPIDVVNWGNEYGQHRSFDAVFVQPPSSRKCTHHVHLPTAVVCEFIRRDPLGHLGRSGNDWSVK